MAPKVIANPLDNGAATNGTTDATTAIQAAITSLTSGGELRMSPGLYLIASNITVPSNVTYIADAGAIIMPNSGITVTINTLGPCPAAHIFGGAGTIILTSGSCDHVLPEWWGADATGVTTSDTAILTAITTGKPVLLGSTYLVNGITVPSSVPACIIYGHGEVTGFKLANSANAPVLTTTGGLPKISLKHFSVDGNTANQPVNSLYVGINIGHDSGITSTDITIEDISLKNGNDIGLYIKQVQNLHIRGVRSTQWARPVYVGNTVYDSTISDVVASMGPTVPGGSAPIAVTLDVLYGVGTYNCTVNNVTAEAGGALFLNGCVGVTGSALTCRGIQDIGVDLEYCTDCTIEGVRCDGSGGSATALGTWFRSCQRSTISGTVNNCPHGAFAVCGISADVEANIKGANCGTAGSGYAFLVGDSAGGVGYDNLTGITSTVSALLTNGQSVIGRNINLRGCSGGRGALYGGFEILRSLNMARVLLDGCVGYGTFPFNIYADYSTFKGCRSIKPGQWGYYLNGSSYGSYTDCHMEFAPGSTFRPIELAGGPGVTAPAAPTLAHTAASTTLAAGTTYVLLDGTNGIGRTVGSTASSVVLVAGDNITFSINMPAEGLGVYVGTTSTPLLLGTVFADGHIVYSGTSTTGLSVTWTYNSSTALQANITITALASATGSSALTSRTDQIPCQHNRFSGFVADGRGNTYDYVIKEDPYQNTMQGTHDYNLIDGTRSNAHTSGIGNFVGSHSTSINVS